MTKDAGAPPQRVTSGTPWRRVPLLGPLLVLVLLASLFVPGVERSGHAARVASGKPWCLIEDPDVPDEAYRVEEFARTHNFSPPPGLKGNSEFVDSDHSLPPLLRPFKEYDVFPPVPGGGRRPEHVIVSDSIPFASWYSPNHYDHFLLMFPLNCYPRPAQPPSL